jgi:hypothetical protein
VEALDVATWTEANQRHLTAALGVVRARVERHAGRHGERDPATVEAAERALLEAELSMPAPSALDALAAAFGLSPFEREVLLLCAGVELDGAFADLCGTAQGERSMRYPTFGLALAALPGAHWSALAPSAPLRRWRLVELDARVSVTAGPLRIDERILHHLTGLALTDERLEGLVEPVPEPFDLPPSHARLAEAIVRLWSDRHTSLPVVQLCGRDRAAMTAVAATACRRFGEGLYALGAEALPPAPAELASLGILWEREAVLSGSVLLVEAEGDESEGHPGTTVRFVDRLRTPVMVSSRDPVRLDRPAFRLDVGSPTALEQRDLWLRALGGTYSGLEGELDAVVAQFDLGPRAIQAAATAVLAGAEDGTSPGLAPHAVWDACRVQARPRLDDLAGRIEPTATWEDLVLPEPQLRTLREMAANARQRWRVYGPWGFERKGPRGLGLSALFAGPSGTGKTLAAEVLAAQLRLDLYRIDLSSVVSKYIGETEKNLRRVFDAADEGGALLLFDEADALFGKRSEVKDSHDRYANIEVGYLLQRMEAYRGLAILTTNLKSALDPAFLRRIRFVVQFPFPDAGAREEIWRRIFPAETPVEGLDWRRLAGLDVAGGSIRNMALSAAFLAADAGQSVRMTHLLEAARSEYAKLEKPLTGAEIGGWA